MEIPPVHAFKLLDEAVGDSATTDIAVDLLYHFSFGQCVEDGRTRRDIAQDVELRIAGVEFLTRETVRMRIGTRNEMHQVDGVVGVERGW